MNHLIGPLAGTLFVAVMATWAATTVVSWRLLALFLKRVGEDAADVPAVLRDPGRHPEKVVYFFRASSVPRLQAEPDLWRLRELLKSLLVPPAGFAVLFLVAFLSRH